MEDKIEILWLRPSTGENVSSRRARIAEHLQKFGIDIEFLTLEFENMPAGMASLLLEQYDLMIGNVRLPLYISFPISKFRNKPFIADVGDPISQISNLPFPIYRLLYRYEWWILERADAAMFAESDSYEIARSRGIDSVLAKNAVNYEMFADPFPETVQFARRELETAGVDLDSSIAIYPGRFSSAYHIEETLAAADVADDWEFVFIGERAKQDAVEHAAEQKSNVYYPGSYAHERVPGFLQHADVGLCLVDVERPLKILEYGAAMLPVLGMPGNLQTEFSEDELWFVKPTDREIATGLERIRNDPEETERRCKNLRRTAQENSWESVAESYFEVIQRVLDLK